MPENLAMEKPILESCTVEKIMPDSPTMEHPVPERPTMQKIKLGSPTMEESMTENPSMESHNGKGHAKLATTEKIMSQGPFRREMA